MQGVILNLIRNMAFCFNKCFHSFLHRIYQLFTHIFHSIIMKLHFDDARNKENYWCIIIRFQLFLTIDPRFSVGFISGGVHLTAMIRIWCFWKVSINVLYLWHGTRSSWKMPFWLGHTLLQLELRPSLQILHSFGNSSYRQWVQVAPYYG